MHHPQIHIVDFDFYNVNVFNQCENSNDILMAIDSWASVHSLLKMIPMEWEYTIPFGLLHSPEPTETVQDFLAVIQEIKKQKYCKLWINNFETIFKQIFNIVMVCCNE